ncbi:hypothetical protein EMIHUDRAFT_208218 [Emiliania huxleyi CCMP1516]|uniref:Sulfotransferase domain-containing protein n=2 Tax=Emiliania huxleyi TaxID=2903 RepID=A0A0D3JC40_EMIH1|nr:hypothetical protein EMIHUDRAFT_208218 [Emiliania huxleyi CCMP1516]EOD21075.1 hypothetical protein EMIHUDRAFT_208218 [Emiliania huxleyi CCMP1516]|eukprot:XP_005773504.1 hypothetical protein EMIHUDRAFT_208218 [Emiliania huxleyi CCMP1516]
MPQDRFCRPPQPGQFRGTFSVTSMGGVGSTFLLEWFRGLEQAYQESADCRDGLRREKPLVSRPCGCAPLSDGGPARHLLSCHVDDDGVFKHLADPSALNRFPDHKAIFLVGSPIEAVASVFRRKFQCWHLYRLNDCWFTRKQREGLIPCNQSGVVAFRQQFGAAASSSVFNVACSAFRSWLSCRAPRCTSDILVVRYETLNASVPSILDFLDVPLAARSHFPPFTPSHHGVDSGAAQQLRGIYGALDAAIERIPPQGLLLRNR